MLETAVERLRSISQDPGYGLVPGVVFLGQREARNGKLEPALGVDLGAQAIPPWGVRFVFWYAGECRRLSGIRKWALHSKTHENGLESDDSRPFSNLVAPINRN